MAEREIPGWNPLADRPVERDDDVLELLAAAVFQARFRPDVVRQRWPAIRRAFAGFRLDVVSRWPDEKAEELLERPGMIRNPKKIRATIRNARDLAERARERGSAVAYLESFGGDGEALVRGVDEWAHYVGAPSIRWFARNLRLRAVRGRRPRRKSGSRSGSGSRSRSGSSRGRF